LQQKMAVKELLRLELRILCPICLECFVRALLELQLRRLLLDYTVVVVVI
jgi:hypothetical protein